MKRPALLAVLLLLAAGARAGLDPDAFVYTAPGPDSLPLERKAEAFRLKLIGVGRAAADKEAALAKRGAELLGRERAKYQAAGDFERATAFSEALAKPDGEIESSVAEIKIFYDWRRAQLAAIRRERAASEARAVSAFSAELAEWKKELVRDGRFAVAKEVDAYEGAVKAALAACRAEAGISDAPAAAADAAAANSAPAAGGFRMPLGRDVTVWASNPQGVVLGDLRAGEVAVFRFKEGSWSDSGGADRMRSPDDPFDAPDHRMALVWDQKQHRGVGTLPSGTKERPFAFRVAAPSTFRLRVNDPAPGDNKGKATWLFTVVSAANADAFRDSEEGRNCQWKFWAPGR